jgi:hypothetical protein
MARYFRLWGKKRGQRLSGWWIVGSVGEAIFFASLFLLGVMALTLVIAWQLVAPEMQVYRVGLGFWLLVIASGSFIVIGGTGFLLRVWQLWASDERRLAVARKAGDIDLAGRGKKGKSPPTPPTIPNLASITDSPGVRLTYRLPNTQNVLGVMLIGSLFTLSWNTMVAVFAGIAFSAHAQGRPRWFLTFSLIPFATAGYFASRWFFRLFRQLTGVGSTTVEINELPLVPSRIYEICVVQHGHLVFKHVRVSLICEEEATFHQGTDLRLERKIVYSQTILEQGRCRVEPGRPLELRAEFKVPVNAMHSFQSAHNAIHWKILVEGDAKRWPSFCRSFPVIVYPAVREPIVLSNQA